MRRPVEAAVREAGRILTSYFRNDTLTHEFKSPRDMVSEADRHAERYLMAELAKIDDIPFLSEEYNPRTALSTGPLWIIDPLDGTTNFLAGIPVYTIAVAHWDGAKVDTAVCYIPPLDEMYRAEIGCGAFLNDAPIRVSDTADPLHAVGAVGFADITKGLPNDTLGVFTSVIRKTRALRRLGSAAADMLYVARGGFDLFWECGLAPWDVAAASLIVTEAGGIVTDFAGGDDFLAGGTIIASNRALYAFIRDEVHRNFGPLQDHR
ncbi:MAG TPA: inositol monophosphatase family protein [bacterium]|nr:inositol monophosphatase family protein [bacterium]